MTQSTIDKKILLVLNELNKYTIQHLGQGLFTNAMSIDEIKDTLEMYFKPYQETEEYEYSIRLGMMYVGISIDEEQFNQHYNKIKKYINILLDLIAI